jgi:hypothetical protein
MHPSVKTKIEPQRRRARRDFLRKKREKHIFYLSPKITIDDDPAPPGCATTGLFTGSAACGPSGE